MRTTPFGRRVPHDREIVGTVGLELEPHIAAAAAVPSIRALTNHPFETHGRNLRQKTLAFPFNMIKRAQWAESWQVLTQQRFSLDEREWAQIKVFERQQVEHEKRCRQLDRGSANLDG